ncbi:DUF4249 domain-containing protein [Flavobacteriales bacterium]|nr:DUF4249 domain-containing protein [Flavobacteriales bacterium]|tara:strand:- start:629 stop:1534 length:906 start_codon:yes stop_codon:yes gene_type:complete
MKSIYYILLICLIGCTKSIDFELPEIEQTIVVEATVESGLPPRVILTNSQGYFEAIDSSILSDIFIHDADVVISDGIESFPLQEINFNGVYLYTSLNFAAVGQYGKTYSLSVQVNDKSVYSTTTIPQPLFIDSLWFDKYVAYDSLGLIGARFSDPDTLGNCYRWFAQRINSYTYNYSPPFDNIIGTIKDSRPLPPIGSSTDDKLFNGLSFDFIFPRGEDGLLQGPDDNNVEAGFYKIGDTILVKSTTTTYPIYLYVRAMENAAISEGSIFSSPGNLPYNIQGDGIGIFYGYGVSYDTLICE